MTHRLTDGRTDRPGYRDAQTHLRTRISAKRFRREENRWSGWKQMDGKAGGGGGGRRWEMEERNGAEWRNYEPERKLPEWKN